MFVPGNSFEANLALFQVAAERLDPECARILFANLAPLSRVGDDARNRQAIQEFHRAVLVALDALPEIPET